MHSLESSPKFREFACKQDPWGIRVHIQIHEVWSKPGTVLGTRPLRDRSRRLRRWSRLASSL